MHIRPKSFAPSSEPAGRYRIFPASRSLNNRSKTATASSPMPSSRHAPRRPGAQDCHILADDSGTRGRCPRRGARHLFGPLRRRERFRRSENRHLLVQKLTTEHSGGRPPLHGAIPLRTGSHPARCEPLNRRSSRARSKARFATANRATVASATIPVFQPDGYAETFGTLGEELKNTISHRARALELTAGLSREKRAEQGHGHSSPRVVPGAAIDSARALPSFHLVTQSPLPSPLPPARKGRPCLHSSS